MDSIAPALYSAAGATIGILEGAVHGAAVLLGKTDEASASKDATSPSHNHSKVSQSEGIGRVSSLTGLPPNGVSIKPRHSLDAETKLPSGNDTSQLNVNAPAFHLKASTTPKQVITPVTAEEAPTPAEAFGDASEAPAPVVTGEITSLSDITHVPLPDEHASYAAAIKDTDQDVGSSDKKSTPCEEGRSGEETAGSANASAVSGKKKRNGTKHKTNK